MLNVTQDYLIEVDSHIRAILTRVKFNGSTTIEREDVLSATVSEVGQSTDSITIGDLCTNSATVKFTMPATVIPLEGGYFQIEHGIKVGSDYEWIPMGTFYISEIETVEGTNKYTVKGYDNSTRFTKDYAPSVTLPTTLKAIVEDVCSQCNVSLETFTFPSITIESIYEASCKDTIKYMAGLMGMNAKINRNGKLQFYWYGSSVRTIGRDIQFMNGFVKSTEEDITINSLTSGTEENTLVSGNGRGISFDNPYMTQSLLDSVLAKVNGFTYTPSKVVYKGNPALEIGDVISVEDRDGNIKTCIIGEQEFILTGLKATIQSKGSTEQETVMKQSPTEIKLKKMYNVMLNAFKDSTDKIIGAKGGHYVIDYDKDGHPTGWRIMDTPTVTDNTKMWIFNKNGLGFSKDGGKTITNFAFDFEGFLNANVIRTGALVGEYFELNLDTGTLVMGERGSNGEFITKWLEVNESGLTLGSSAYVTTVIESTNGFTISENVYSTELTARIYEGNTEVDADGNLTYTWYISTNGGTSYSQLGTGKKITLSTSQIGDNTKVYFEAN